MAHTPPIIINSFTNTIAYFSTDTPENLVIFVHGFKGSATGTWIDFPDLIRNEPAFGNTDVLFYGYESLAAQANVHAKIFADFLVNHAESMLMRNFYTKKKLPSNFRYPNIVLVAHSLGAIVVRRALIILKKRSAQSPLVANSKMILFAPAHRGTLVKSSYFTGLPGIVQLFGIALLFKTPVLENLQSSSDTIKDLLEDTKKWISKNDGQFTIARHVVWPEQDRIVFQDYFDENENPIVFPMTDHQSVCKPKKGKFNDPIDLVVRELINQNQNG